MNYLLFSVLLQATHIYFVFLKVIPSQVNVITFSLFSISRCFLRKLPSIFNIKFKSVVDLSFFHLRRKTMAILTIIWFISCCGCFLLLCRHSSNFVFISGKWDHALFMLIVISPFSCRLVPLSVQFTNKWLVSIEKYSHHYPFCFHLIHFNIWVNVKTYDKTLFLIRRQLLMDKSTLTYGAPIISN